MKIQNNFEASINIVVFHVKVPSHATKINTPDIKGANSLELIMKGYSSSISKLLFGQNRMRELFC